MHHAKRGEKRSRGSDALEAWADVVAMADGKGDQRKLSVVRSNTVDEGVKATFKLQPVDLGEDEETGSRSSVVIAMPADRSAPTSFEPIRLAPDVEMAFAAIQKQADPIAFEEWRSLVMAAYSDKPTANARRVAFSNAKKKLEDEGLIIIENETVSVRNALS